MGFLFSDKLMMMMMMMMMMMTDAFSFPAKTNDHT